MGFRRIPAALRVVAATAFYATEARGINRAIPPVGGNWTMAANRSPAGVPAATDHAIVPLRRTAALSASQNIDQLACNGRVSLQDGVIVVINGNNTPFINGTGEVRTPANVA